MHLLLIVTWALIGVSLTTARTIEKVVRGADGETERIIGGTDAAAGQFPFAAALHYNGQFICTASIISPTSVLTAAHCVYLNGEYQPADSFYLIANVSRVAQSVRINVARVIPHPEYDDSSVDNDVAVLKTVEEIEFSDEVGPVCIAGPETQQEQYKNATAIGWGNTSRFRLVQNIPETLQHVEQKIVPNLVCTFTVPAVNENKLCATGFLTGICQGDSGGPLVHLSADQPPVQIGITSYLNALFGCGKASPGVFARVSSYYEFIRQAAQDDSICSV